MHGDFVIASRMRTSALRLWSRFDHVNHSNCWARTICETIHLSPLKLSRGRPMQWRSFLVKRTFLREDTIPEEAQYHHWKSLNKSQKPKGIKDQMMTFQKSHPITRELHLYSDRPPPSEQALRHANSTFRNKGRHLFSTHEVACFPPDSTVPEVILIGRSNVGKSTLINALCGARRPSLRLASVSDTPGHTKCLHVYGIGNVQGGIKEVVRPGMSKALFANNKKDGSSHVRKQAYIHGSGPSLVLVDTPGYGAGSQFTQGQTLRHYFQGRKQLRRAFVLLDARRELKGHDLIVIKLLLQHNVPTQIVVTKIDKFLYYGGQSKSGPHELVNLERLRAYCTKLREDINRRLNESKERRIARRRGQKPPPGQSEEQSQQPLLKLTIQDFIFVSPRMVIENRGFAGVSELRWAMLQACGLDVLDQKEFLEGIPIIDDDPVQESGLKPESQTREEGKRSSSNKLMFVG